MTQLQRSAVFLLTLASLWLCVARGFAATAVRDELSPEARKDWDAARELYEARDYKSALVHFEKTYELSKNPRVLFNVGVCWKDLTQYALAIGVWERALGFRERLSSEDVQKLEYAVSAARPFVSSLRIESDQVGALLSIDGYQRGRTPFVEPIPIDVGRREIVLQKDGFTPTVKTIDVVQGSPIVVAMNLVPLQKTGTVVISTAGGAAATLFMDGRELGPAPYSGEVPEGPHTFEARAPGFGTTRQTSQVAYGKSLKLVLALAKSQNEGKVRILVDHEDAQIKIDGALKGRGAWEGILPAGGHQLIVEKSQYEAFTQEIALSQGQERTVEVRLHKKPSWVWWVVGAATVVGGGTLTAVLLAQPSDTSHVSGTLDTVAPRFP